MNQQEIQPAATNAAAVTRRGVVAVVLRDERLLVIQRSRHVLAPGTYCFPGGSVEPGETEEQALRRELQEELAVSVTPRQRLWTSVTPWGVALSWWLAELSRDAIPVAQPAEVAAFEWYTPTEIASLPGLLESNHAFLHALSSGQFTL